VASHTSAFSFKGGKVDIPTVAQKLNVATILEGSVRKVGKRVRITVQLVEAATDSHLWSDTYDRELEDIFAVQDDIAQSVVKELRSALLGEKLNPAASAAVTAEVRVAAKGRGENPEAHRLYLQGRVLVARSTQQGVTTGIEYFTQAVTLDPDHALAWAALALARTVEAGSGGWAPYKEGYGRAREAAERALALEPDLAEGHMALAFVRRGTTGIGPGRMHQLDGHWSWRRETRRSCWPRRRWLAVLAASTSRSRFAGERLRSIPQRAGSSRSRLNSLFGGLPEQAETALQEALELDPLSGMTHAGLGNVYLEQHRFEEALAAFEKESVDGFRLLGLSVALHALGRSAASSAALEQLSELPAHKYLNAQARAYRGEVDQAFEWLERAYVQRNAGLSQVKVQPLLRNLHGDPRWQIFLKKIRLAD
jgi:tetratricopeptide (TPR) repeat protein